MAHRHGQPAGRRHQPAPRPRLRSRRMRATGPPGRAYPDRRTALSRALALWPHELDDESPDGRRHILRRLRRALRAERRRGMAGHWAYDLMRHVELLRLYRVEAALLLADDRRAKPTETTDADLAQDGPNSPTA